MSRPRSAWVLVAASATLLGAAGAFLVLGSSPTVSLHVASPTGHVALPTQAELRSPGAAAPPRPRPEQVHAMTQLQPQLQAPRERSRDEPDPAPGGHGVIPHPMNDARRTLNAQHALFAQVKAALSHQDFERARNLLTEHDRTFSGAQAWHDLREGYQLLADCKQHPSAETQARGKRFVDEQRGSTLRRAVRRACTAGD